MKILHTSHTGLPDSRIEKTAYTMKKKGHEMLFLGGTPTRRQGLGVFSETYHEQITNSLRLVLEGSFKRRWLRKIEEINPDVVHAHNIIAAAMMLETDFPVVYDDHEYWSKEVFKFSARSFFKRLTSKLFVRAIPKWEREVLESYPVITVGENIAKEHREIARFAGVTKNYPLLAEVADIVPKSGHGNVYIGNDFNKPRFLPHRDMSGLSEYIEFDTLSGLPHHTMMEKLTEYKVGLTPWNPHPFHFYCEPNKNYEYMHAGLQVVVTESLARDIADLDFVHTFTEYSELPTTIKNIDEINTERIVEFARENYVWENQEDTIIEVYKHA